jgi:hypothetical protein
MKCFKKDRNLVKSGTVVNVNKKFQMLRSPKVDWPDSPEAGYFVLSKASPYIGSDKLLNGKMSGLLLSILVCLAEYFFGDTS